MKNLKQMLRTTVASTFILATLTAAACAAQTSANVVTPTTTTDHANYIEDSGISLLSSIAKEYSLNSKDGSQSILFQTTGYPYYRIYVQNDSNVTYNITLVDINGKNELTTPNIKVEGGKHVTMTNKNPASGKRELSITAMDGSPLKGRVTIRLAEYTTDLG